MQKSNSSRMKLFLPVVAIVVLVGMVAWMAGAFKEKVAPGSLVEEVVRAENLVEVVRSDLAIFEPVPASIEAKLSSTISSRILARIEKVHVRSGDKVQKGQLLISLEKADLQSRVSQSEAQLGSINARLTEAKLSLDRSKELNRKGLLAKASLEASQANYDTLQANLLSAKQVLLEAKTALNFAEVRSPIDGLIVDRLAEPGNTAQPGVPLLSLYNPSSVRVEAHVREALAVSIVLGQALRVFVPSSKRWLDSIVEELVPAGNKASRSFLVKSRISENQALLPGMYARLMVPAGRESRLLIPKERVVEVGQLNVVWVYTQGRAERRFIRTGKGHDKGLVDVISGLDAGEKLLPVQK